MKLPKPDFSKQGMQKFFLHHAEKLVLLVALIGTGVFFYLGFSTPSFEDTTPKKLTSLADSAQQYILQPTSWDTIKDYRKGDDEALKRLSDAESRSLLASDFRDGVLNIKARSAGKRDDPALLSVENLNAVLLTAPILVKGTDDKGKPYPRKIRSLPIASLADQEAMDDGKDDEDDGRGGLGGGSLGGPGDSDETDKKEKKKDPNGIIHGTQLPEYVKQLMRGVRPKGSTDDVWMGDMVLVTGIVDIEKQWEEYNKSLLGKRGYWPVRDRPIYQYMEIERASKAPGADAWSDWEEISAKITGNQEIFPASMANGAPEIIDPKFYDPVLTLPIPPITLVDYREQIARQLESTNVAMRHLMPPKPKVEQEFASAPADNSSSSPFDRFNSKKDDGDDKKDGDGEDRLGGGKNESGGSSTLTDPKGSDFTKYLAPNKAFRAPKAPVKLVRFFDMQVEKGYAYKYRVRLWLSDPNDENPDGLEVVKKKEERGSDLGSATGGLEGGETGGAAGGEEGEEDETSFTRIQLNRSMLKEGVRVRLARKSTGEIPESADDGQKAALEYARVTNPGWQGAPESNEVFVVSKKADFYAGGVRPGRQLRINNQLVPDGEPVAEIVASELSREYHATIPGHRLVRRSDVLNFQSDTNILDPADWTKVLKARSHQFKTDAVVVDMMGGSEIREISGVASASRASMKYEIPGEILLMDFEHGTFRVQNDTEDRGGFKRSLFLEDEIAEVGKRKKKKKASDSGDGGGGFDF